ncbi:MULTISPECIES: aspartate/glutamate racemase family protein [unclassified Achromobacter]|uniref:aspartate/glutamate racemase family protein n=1 Tax=unclassified Achromobacter TaxID=2626865 RepID=UPI000B51732A|nr:MULTISPECIES: aspartate/glutamate racemase family protein [unclassified Achromobacter]OWT71530.1 Asp/Glu racemase [Achromobacter sp. HZ34]OWT73187.1 Asp/Glu racemase [Achromobacter sp. HZ28]
MSASTSDDHPRIVVINPNSLTAMTGAVADAVSVFARLPVRIDCLTAHDGPPGIESQLDSDLAVGPLFKLAKEHAADAAAIIIACFSDPGLWALREHFPFPVLGIGEAGMLTAMATRTRIGVIAATRQSLPRHYRYFSLMGLEKRVVGERALDLHLTDLEDEESTFKRLAEVACTLRDEDGAEVLVMGCAGFGRQRARLEQACGLPVIEPSQAAVGMAVAQIFAGAHASK